MNIILAIKITGFMYLVYLYLKNNKYRPFLYLVVICTLFFVYDIWKILSYYFIFPGSLITIVDKTILVFDFLLVIMMIGVIWKLLRKK